jgi:diadenosine tetraphosphatase ApaH/serine/threonine PP2A family protein phosphatase
MDLDRIIQLCRAHEPIAEKEIVILLKVARQVLIEEGTLLNLALPMTVCGDIHGQLYDLFRLFELGGDPGSTRYLFLGDYVDRGFFSVETFALLIAYKIKYRDSFYMLRGNHECRQVSLVYGFYDENIQRFGHSGVWRLFIDVFDLLPLAALLDDRIYCVHGGLSPSISQVDQVSQLDRRMEVPAKGPITDMLWSDPESISGWGTSTRGCGCVFGEKPVREFVKNNELDLIVRSHQLMTEGYGYHFKGEQLVTVWSAPNYMYRVRNRASVLVINEDGRRRFVVFEAMPAEKRRIPDDRLSPYFL